LFTYSFLVMGSFAVITVVAGRGDAHHDLDSFRGLARRQPWLAVPMIIFLLAQAGLPATTGLWAKIYVIEGAVGTPGGDALAVIAMLSAVIAAFFYLRLVLYMVSSPGVAPAIGEGLDAPDPVDPAADSVGSAGSADSVGSAGSADSVGSAGSAVSVGSPYGDESGLEPAGVVTTLQIPDTEDGVPADADAVPLSIATGIAICAGFTVLFGVWPSPIINFAHAATLILH
jgi:NADH-quinone oxidoreductase subunit N